jgi:hypothetical protein
LSEYFASKEILKAKYSKEALLLTIFLRDVLVVLKQLSIIEPKRQQQSI